ncbi:MAG: glycosyltransferase family 39 protein [Anaerolineae bacterium]|nr:glycosyltransferase family 39 protein [Anaerolineae bacterium]
MMYSIITPIFETPDEPFHYRYVRWLLEEKTLPPLVVSEDEWEQGEFHQPPFYYLLGALLTAPVDVPAGEPICERNPYANLGLPHAPGNKNAVLHASDEGLPYAGVSLAVHMLRWFGVACSAATVWLTYRIAAQVVPRRPAIALGAAALTAFNPQFIFCSAAANNDSLVTLLSTLVLYLSLRVCISHGRPYASPVAIGIAVGLAGLTKLSGLAAGVVAVCAYACSFWRRSQRRIWQDLVRPLAILSALALSICGWWYVRNALRWGDLFGMRSYSDIFGVYPEHLPLSQTLIFMFEALLSYWGVFGWMNVLADELFYLFVRVLSILALVGMLLLALRVYGERHLARYRRRGALLMAIWAGVVLILLFRWTQTITRTQGRLMFPAIAALSFFLIVGILEWVPRRFSAWLIGALTVILLSVSVVAPFRYIQPAYALPPRLTLETVPDTIRGLDVALGEEIFLLGYDLPDESVTVGERLRVRLYWLARKKMRTNYTIYLHLFGRDEERIGALDTFPGAGMYPTSQWIPGEVIVDQYWLPVDPTAQAPVGGALRVGIYEDLDTPLPAWDTQGNAIGPAPQIARVRVAPAVISLYEPAERVDASFGAKMLLMGYGMARDADTPDAPWHITLYWRALIKMSHDYTVFLHLLDGSGELVAQVDEQPLGGQYPTSLWALNEQVKDEHWLSLPRDLPPGEYRLVAGLYLLETGERLTIEGQEAAEDSVTLETIAIDRDVASR